jgi:hypothetical protein
MWRDEHECRRRDRGVCVERATVAIFARSSSRTSSVNARSMTLAASPFGIV